MPDNIRITVLGSAAGIPTPKRFNESVCVESGSGNFLFDVGDAAAGLCVRNGIDVNSLDAVFVSHMHPDHVGGLAMLLQTMQLTKRKKPLKIFLPGEGVSVIRQYLDALYLFKEVLPFTLSFGKNLKCGKIFEKGSVSVSSCGNTHLNGFKGVGNCKNKCQSYSFRLNIGNQSLIYSGDIKFLNELIPLAATPVDVMILEWAHCMIYDKISIFNNKVNKLIVNHIHHEFDLKPEEIKVGLRRYFKGNIIIAWDNLKVEC